MHAAEHVCHVHMVLSRTLTLSLKATRRHRGPCTDLALGHGVVWLSQLSPFRSTACAYVPNGDIAPSHRQHSTRHEGRRLRLTAQNGPSQTHQKTLSFLSPIWYSCGILNPRETVQVAASRSAVACARCSARNDRRCARSSFSRPAAASGSVR